MFYIKIVSKNKNIFEEALWIETQTGNPNFHELPSQEKCHKRECQVDEDDVIQ